MSLAADRINHKNYTIHDKLLFYNDFYFGTTVAKDKYINCFGEPVMSVSKNELKSIKQQHIDFHDLVQECNHDELGQCAKLLAMYVAIYKQRYGELPLEKLSHMADTLAVNKELSQIIQEGIVEASTMLRMVRDEQRQQQESFYYYPAEYSIN